MLEIREIQVLIEKKSYAELRRIGHRMMGSGLTYGVRFVTVYGEHLKVLSEYGDLEAIRHVTAAYVIDLESFKAYISSENRGV